MVICKTYNNEVLWLHSDDTVKDLDEFKDDENVFIIDKYVEFKIKPDDENIYKQMWNEDEQDIYLLKVGLKPLTLDEKTDIIKNNIDQFDDDLLSAMELEVDTNTKVQISQDDNLLNMEMLITLQEQIGLIQNLLIQNSMRGNSL
ncbi:MAG: hypothetical protein KID02_09540 [Clostridiales bacterium]|nr:hypothetical protein [Clostridiales bacterium]